MTSFEKYTSIDYRIADKEARKERRDVVLYLF